MAAAPAPTNQWQAGLFSFDLMKCAYVFCLPNCAYAGLRQNYDNSNFCFNCLCTTPCVVRNIIREGYGIEGTCVNDIIFPSCLPCCVFVQTALEVEQPNRQARRQALAATDKVWESGSLITCNFGADCLYAWCLPQCAIAGTRTRYDSSNCIFNVCCVPGALAYNIVREGYGIGGTCLGDIIIGGCLPCCAAHRLQREIAIRGPHQANNVAALPGEAPKV